MLTIRSTSYQDMSRLPDKRERRNINNMGKMGLRLVMTCPQFEQANSFSASSATVARAALQAGAVRQKNRGSTSVYRAKTAIDMAWGQRRLGVASGQMP